MKTQEVVALPALESGANSPGEFCIAVVDDRGVLHQVSGDDPAVAEALLAVIAEQSERIEAARRQILQEERRAAQERGDTPEMPRHSHALPSRRPGGPKPIIGTGIYIKEDDASAQ